MNFGLVIRSEAEDDLTEAYWWYEDRREGLGSEFELCFEETVSRLMRFPESFGIVYDGLRRMQLRRFPYGVYYEIIDDTVAIAAVFHSRQELSRLSQRKRKT